jgi:hypothetical protein
MFTNVAFHFVGPTDIRTTVKGRQTTMKKPTLERKEARVACSHIAAHTDPAWDLCK